MIHKKLLTGSQCRTNFARARASNTRCYQTDAKSSLVKTIACVPLGLFMAPQEFIESIGEVAL